MRILFTAVGKRIQLIEHFKQSFEVIGVDMAEDIAAKYFVDLFANVPSYKDKRYIDQLLAICEQHKVDCIIPLYEKEFTLLAKQRNRFKEIGVNVLLSSEKVIQICNDKKDTSEFFKKHSIRYPECYDNINAVKLPVIIKPRDGMGSESVFKATTTEELAFFYQYVSNPIIEELIEGDEYTVDILCDMQGKPIYIVPRLRLEIRSGEVTKTQIMNDRDVVEATEKVLEELNKYKDAESRGIQGPMTIQCFKKNNGEVVFLEINPRLGGGVPLSFEAGANYGAALSRLLKGELIERIYQFTPLKMMRYERAVFEKC